VLHAGVGVVVAVATPFVTCSSEADGAEYAAPASVAHKARMAVAAKTRDSGGV
jgi:hypothetical protein